MCHAPSVPVGTNRPNAVSPPHTEAGESRKAQSMPSTELLHQVSGPIAVLRNVMTCAALFISVTLID